MRSPRRWLAGLAIAALTLPPLSLTPYLVSGTEVVKLRNAALLQQPLAPAFDWAAPPPADYPFDEAPFDPYFVAIAEKLALATMPDDWQRVLAISRHLLGSHVPLLGGGVQKDLKRTHAAIVGHGLGYCADFVRVFMAIASAAGMQVRAWAFSFDGFGGRGHTFPEVWNRQLKRWQMVDIFNNFYFATAADAPLSAAEFRHALMIEPDGLRMLPLDPHTGPGWEIRAKAMAYFQQGVDEWYLFWGSNVLGVERAAAYRALKPLSFRLAQVGAVVQGVYPGVRPLPTPANADRIEDLRSIRFHMLVALVAMAVGSILALAWLLSRLSRAEVDEVTNVE